MRSFRLVPTLNSFANTTAVFLPLALALAVLLPAGAEAKTYDLGNGLQLEYSSHPQEGDSGNYKIKISNSTGWTFPTNVSCNTESGTANNFDAATPGTDYTNYSGSFTFLSASEEKTVTIQTIEDTNVEGDERFRLKCLPAGKSGGNYRYLKVMNDDTATITVTNASVSEGGSMTFTVKHTGANTDFTFKATPSYSNGTAENADYTTNTTAIDFTTKTSGETKTFTVATIQDAVLEANETFTVSLGISGQPKNAGISGGSGTGTINNDDSAEVTIDDASASEGDAITFTVTLDEAVEGGLTVTPGSYSNTGTHPASSSDYTQNTTGISFTGTKGEPKTFTVSTTEDTDIEYNETFTVGLSTSNAPSGVTSTDTGTGTINDDEADPYVVVNNASVNEGDSGTTDLTFTARLVNGNGKTLASKKTVTANYQVLSETGYTATAGTDYTTTSGTLTFNADETSKTIDVDVSGDEVVENDETLTWKWGSYTNSRLASYTYTGTITNDDNATVTINDASALEGSNMTFTVTLSEAVQGGLTVTPSFTDVSADEGTDYTENTTALTFSGTKGETKTFTVGADQDAVFEGNETFTVSLTVSDAPSGITATATGTGTVHDDDSAELTIDDVSAAEGDSLEFTVTLSEAVQGGLTATPSYTNGTAASTDYKENTAGISFTGTKGETQTFKVATIEDAVLENAETLTVGLSVSNAPSGITATDTGTGTINNDDSAAVTIDDANADEGDDMTFTVILDKAVQGGLTVGLGYTDVTADVNIDYFINTTSLSFSGTKGETQTFTATAGQDAVLENSETFTVGLTVSGAPSGVTSTDTGTGTVNDDDGATVTINDASASEGDAMTFTVTLDKAVQGGLTVTPGYTNGTAASADYTENTTSLSFSGTVGETKSFTVSTTEDVVFEGNETFTVGLSVSGAPSGVTSTDTGTGTINNDDSAEVTIDDANASEGDAMTFTVTLDKAVQGGLTVTPGYTDVTTASGDYTANTTALSFSGTKGETKSFSVSTTEDAVLEHGETFTVGLTVSNAPSGITSTDTGTGTIDNDDSAEVTVNDADADEGDAITFTVTLSEAVQGGLTVTPGYTNGTAASADYTANTTALSFSGTKGETKSFSVSTTEEANVEADETFTVGLIVSNAPSGVTSTDTGEGTIDNDDSSTLTIDDADADEGDAITFTVTLSEAVQGGLTVTPGYTNGTAASGDYTANTAGVSFSGTKGETKTFTVSTTEDAVLESDETFTVGLTVSNAPSGITATDTGTGTIDNDDSSTLTIDDADADEGDAITFTVTLSEAVQGGLTVTPGYTNGTASSGDYTKNTAGISFSGTKGETRTFSVSTTEDAVLEHNETFTVGLTVSNQPSGTTVTSSDTGEGTIDNDDASEVTVNDAAASEGDAITFTVTLSEAVQGGLTVTPGYSNGSAESGDYSKNTSALNFSGTKGETKDFTVSTTEDAVVEYDETFTVSLTISGTSLSVGHQDTGRGTINNDDSAEVTVNDAGATEGGSMTFTVTLSEAVEGGLTVTPGYGNVSAESGDYTPNTSGIGFSGGKGETRTFAVATTQDVVVESNETFRVSLSVSKAPSGVTSSDTGTGTINNDDSAAVTINDARVTEGGGLTFRVTLSQAVEGGLTVTPGYSDQSASNADYTRNTAGVGFAGNANETRTFTVSTTEDGAVESDETFTVSLSVSNAPAGISSTDTGTGTIVDDDVAPSAALSGPAGPVAGIFDLTIAFSEAVRGFDAGDVTVSNGGARLLGSGADYTATITPSASGTVTVEVGAAVAYDAAGNDNTASQPYTVEADLVAPTVSVSGPADTLGGPFTVTIDFSEAVAGFEESEVTVTNGTARLSGSVASYTAQITPASNGPVTVEVAAGVAQDAAGNGNTASAPYTVEADLVAPTVSLSGPAGPVPGAFDLNVTFSEAVSGFAVADLDVSNGSASSLSGSDASYTVRITPASGGAVTVGMAAGTVADLHGHPNSAAVSYTVEADMEAPSVSVSGPQGPVPATFDVTITFSEAVTGFDASEVTVTNGTAQLSGSGSSYTAQITASSSGAVTVEVGAGVAQDAAGNDNTASAQYTVQADLEAPSVTLSGPSATQTGVFDVTIDFSEPVTGFDESEVTVTNGTATLSGSGTSYTAQITPSSSGTVTVEVAAGVATDAVGNDNSAAAAYTVEADLVAPSVTLSGPAGPVRGAFRMTVTFSEAVTDFDSTDLTVGNGTATLSGSGAGYDAVITPSSSGTVTVEVAAGATVDAHGHLNSASARYTVEADLVAPTVSLSGPAGPVPGAFEVTVTFSEGVEGFEASELTVGNGAASSLSGSGAGYDAVITPSSSGAVTVEVAAGVAQDAAGHDNTASARYTVQADLEAPSVSVSGPADTQGGPFEVTLTFSEAVTDLAAGDLTVGNGAASSLSGSGASYTARITPSSSGTVTVEVAAGTAQDAAGHDNTASARYSVEADLVAPSVTLSGPADTQTGAFEVTVTFSEPVSGFVAADVTVTNGTATLSGSGASYTVRITPSSSGTVTVEVAAGVASDTHGHLNSAAVPYSVQADLTPPSAASNRPPQFSGSSARSVAENTPSGAAIGAPVGASDADGDTLTYSLSGTDAASFAVDSGSGQLRTRAALDYETRTTYAVTVVVSDGQGGSARQAVTLSVTDVDEPPPAPGTPVVTGASSTELTVRWTAPASAGGPPVSGYALQVRIAGSGAAFADAGTAAALTATLDGLVKSTDYEVQVRARNDEGAGPWSASGQGRTHDADASPADADLADLAEMAEQTEQTEQTNQAPQFGSSGSNPGAASALQRSVAENTPSGAAIGAPVGATDADADTLTYSLEGADAASFSVDSGSGQLRTLAPLDYETRTTYAVMVAVSDGQGSSARQAVAIAVTDVDEAPMAADDEAAVDEGGSVRIDVLANDADAEGKALTIHLVEEASHGAVRIAAGAVTYAHDGGETRADGFRYRVHDGNLYSEAARVTIAVAAVNDAPIADAGPDQTVAEEARVELSGSGTDPEEEALTFAWSQVSGAAVSLSDAASAAPGFTAPAQLSADAALVFRLVVTDASGADSAPDEVTVTVEAGANDAPIADAGADQTVAEGEAVSLQGSGTDPEGEALSYSWSQVSGASMELSGADSDSLSFTAPRLLTADAVLVFELVVTDARGLASAPDQVQVTVTAAPNEAPVFAVSEYTFGLVEHVDARANPLTVGDVAASDPEDEGVTYALALGDSSRFAVDAASGRITYKGSGEDAEATESYQIEVSATDPRQASSTVTVNILVGVARVAQKSVLSAEQMAIKRHQRAEVMELTLAALARTLAASTVDVLGRRVESSASGQEDSYAEVAGRRVGGASAGASAALRLEGALADQEGAGGAAVTDDQLLSGSSFQWSLQDRGRGVWTLWGRGAFNGFAGEPRNRDFSMHDGQLSQGYMGLDYRRGGDTLMGVALAHGNSRLYYQSGSVGRGDVVARLMSVYPYARWAPRRGLDLWGVVGVGRGQAKLVSRGRTDLNSDVGLRLAAVGARNLLLTYLGVEVAARADAFAVRLQPEENEELAEVRADAQRLRLLLEGSTNWTLTPRSRLTPSLEVGGRWDRGDADRGLGAEVGGGLHYAHQDNGLDVEVRGRRLLAHGESAFKDWGASVVLRLAPGDRRGLGLELEPAWGQGARQQSAQTLWQDEQAMSAGEGGSASLGTPDRTDLRVSYGVAHPAGLLMPFGELALGAGTGSLRLGARWAGDDEGETGQRWLEIFGEQRAHEGAAPERRIGLQGNLTY